jgi:hypothetical protein
VFSNSKWHSAPVGARRSKETTAAGDARAHSASMWCSSAFKLDTEAQRPPMTSHIAAMVLLLPDTSVAGAEPGGTRQAG